MNPLELRPDGILRLFWLEQLVIEEDATFYETEYLYKEAA